MAIGARAVIALTLNLSTGDDVTEKSEHRGDGQQAVALDVGQKPHGQPEIRRDAATPAVKQARMPSVNLVGNYLHGVSTDLTDRSGAASLDR